MYFQGFELSLGWVIDLHQVKAHLRITFPLVLFSSSGLVFVWKIFPGMTQLAQRLMNRVPDYIQAGDEAV